MQTHTKFNVTMKVKKLTLIVRYKTNIANTEGIND